jgi:hypothetical protein
MPPTVEKIKVIPYKKEESVEEFFKRFQRFFAMGENKKETK